MIKICRDISEIRQNLELDNELFGDKEFLLFVECRRKERTDILTKANKIKVFVV